MLRVARIKTAHTLQLNSRTRSRLLLAFLFVFSIADHLTFNFFAVTAMPQSLITVHLHILQPT